MNEYSALSRAQLSFDYLHTNSTTHEFLFGALAEIIDNARDAKSTKISIYTVGEEKLRGGHLLCFLDDGEGMSPEEAGDIITFGKSSKRSADSSMIGMYGNGLKSGSMRIGNDLMVFTKKDGVMTAVFLSRTFHEQEAIDEIIVPMPSFDANTRKPLAKTAKEKEIHKLEMDLIYKYSPFKTASDFFMEFDKITDSGTLVIIYNLKLMDNGAPELDVHTDEHDILLASTNTGDFDSDEGTALSDRLMPERKSFRAYTSVMYVDPRMRIYIQGKKVQTKRLANCLYKPRMYKYSSGRFKTRSEADVAKAKEDSKIADHRAREAESKARNLENKLGQGGGRDARAELRKMQTNALELRKEAQMRKQMADRKARSLREPKTLNFIFGVNLDQRNQDGCFVYNCSRLIKMYQKVGPQADGGVFCSGVVGIVDVPYMVLEPTHNKQDFADAKEYRHLCRAMGEHMVQYWKDLGIASQGVTKFWEAFGYTSPNWRDPPALDNKYIRKRAMQIQITLQCDLCLKWRMLPFSSNHLGKKFPDDWVCSMNPDPSHNRCSAPEHKIHFPEGVLKKETKTKEQKEKDLAEEIKKKQEALKQMQKTKIVTSSRSLRRQETSSSEEEEEEEPPAKTSRRSMGSSNSRSASKPSPRAPIKRATPVRRKATPPPESSSEEEEQEEPPVKRGRGSTTPKPTPKPPAKKTPQPIKSTSRSSNQRAANTSAVKSGSRAAVAEKRPVPAATSARSSRAAARAPSTEEEEDDEEVAPTPPTSAQTPPTSGSSTPPTSGVGAASTTTSTSKASAPAEDENHVTRRKPSPKPSHTSEKEESDKEGKSRQTEAEKTKQLPDSNHKGYEMGMKVEILQSGKWIAASVVEVKGGKCRVKLNKYPQEKHDKWYDQNSIDVRLAKESKAEEENEQEAVATSSTASDVTKTTQEAPSSSTPATQDIINGYRTCLRYFLPPNWLMDKDHVSTLSVEELASFPLDEFFDHYEKGLRKLVSSFQLEAQTRQQEADTAKNKLSAIRKMISKLLKSINEEFDIDPECDTDQVDELLALCVKQAVQQAEDPPR